MPATISTTESAPLIETYLPAITLLPPH